MRRELLGVCAGITLAALCCFRTPSVRAETAQLELKRLDVRQSPMIPSGERLDYLVRSTYPQHFFVETGSRDRANLGEFKRLVKKEPKYYLKDPLCAVAHLGGKPFVFAIDAKDEKAEGYNRLYFDRNGNGDLTDDPPIDADPKRSHFSKSYSQSTFPQVDLDLNVEGTKVPYSFTIGMYSNRSKESSYASASLNAAAYRQGEITLEGKKHKLVLVDFNSNGRFDDELQVDREVHRGEGQVYARRGDVLLIDPTVADAGRSPYDLMPGGCRHQVAKLINLNGKFYDLKITPAGDRLSLTPSKTSLGAVHNPNRGYRALVYSSSSAILIQSGEDGKASLPEGQWRLLAYTIEPPPAAPSDAKKPEKVAVEEEAPAGKAEGSLWGAIVRALTGSSPAAERVIRSGPTLVSAEATDSYPAVSVKKGQTAELPFGPPYKPVVKVSYFDSKDKASLNLSLVGSAGEVCSDIQVKGSRPSGPEFSIYPGKDKKAEAIEQGRFRYG